MWRFVRKPAAPPWYEEELQRVHVVQMQTLQRQQGLEQLVSGLVDSVQTAKNMEKRMAQTETAIRSLATEMAGTTERFTATIDQVRGLATGARGGRPRNEDREAERQALELGQQIIRLMSTPEGRAQLVLDIQKQDAATVGPNGASNWNPRVNGSPV